MIRKFFSATTSDTSTSVGLLLLRVGICFNLFVKHGFEKITGYSQAAVHFKDPIHIGQHASLTMALFSDSICSVLIAFGFATRAASLYVFTMLFIIFALVHQFQYFGAPEHVEVVALYMSAFLGLIFTGPGKYSIDAMLSKRR